ncbi:MAG TPA: aminotransferase class I/II-fold pyridoxal phosphate-dependent enzyme [Burkholderiales bacterium]|nr:aminotransferase class I/II-fold pyridoxal phosphate-dependent enzyme [Burkholderiales bacterium]
MPEPLPRSIAERFRTMKPSATVEASERIRQARAAGRRILGLSSGDPGVATDPRIIAAAAAAMREGQTHYSSPAGEPGLRAAIAQREAARSGACYDPADILVTPGGKFALVTALMGVVNPGEAVLVPEPGWVSYGAAVRLAGGTPVAVPMLDRLDPAALEAAITPRTSALILNSPVNPTGRILGESELAEAIALAERHRLWIVFDQVYADLAYDVRMIYPQALPGGFARTLVVDSLSKSFGMTGWRLGYLALPPGLAAGVVKFLQHTIYCVPPFIQKAGEAALALGRPRHGGGDEIDIPTRQHGNARRRGDGDELDGNADMLADRTHEIDVESHRLVLFVEKAERRRVELDAGDELAARLDGGERVVLGASRTGTGEREPDQEGDEEPAHLTPRPCGRCGRAPLRARRHRR